MPVDMPKESYIWNLNNPNFPEKTLLPPSPLCTMAFNTKNSDIIAGGSYNGSVSFFDTRQGDISNVVRPFKTTLLEKSHHDPVYDLYWTSSKTGSECSTVSTDGRLMWWDKNSPDDEPFVPIECKELEEKMVNSNGEEVTKVLGGTSMEFNADAGPTKYLVGTE